ncbi:uncharacterized protein LOC107415722 [Ziziphus jujuba]|uniref:Uncharacterized protein LOC107415722 n=1 Tax=Ziziphus jujuba TaxID=326968 RepID=A0ABM3IFI0_ZIZJJ|nr:uncharacterized protein LOC107415722 [Ziziphus jujuba]
MREQVRMWNKMRGNWNNMRRVLWNRIPRNELEPGAHIYTWRCRGANTKEVHHGIYFDDGNVIHFTQGGLRSYHRICRNCGIQPHIHGVVSSCLDCFLSGGDHDLYLFEYGVSPDLFLLRPGWNTCTPTRADPNHENVRHRAFFLLRNGFVGYHLYIKNSCDFAIYCKTGLIVFTSMNVGRNESSAYILAVTAFVFFALLKSMPLSFTALASGGHGIYSTCRLALDVGARPDVIQVEVDRSAKVLRSASHYLGFPRTIRFFFKPVWVSLMWTIAWLVLGTWSKSRPLVWALAGFKFLYWAIYNRTFHIRWVLTNKIERRQLLPGDHIYTWRGYFYAHHGIYVGKRRGKRKVIHLTRGDAPITPSWSIFHRWWGNGDQITGDRVRICNMRNFLKGGKLYRYDYGVDLDFFIAKSRGGTGTLASSHPPEFVLHRAYFLLENGFGAYNLFHNNCEDFAIYCKTGLLVPSIISLGRSGQISSIFAAICAIISFPYSLLLTDISNFVRGLAVGYVLYSIWRLFSDTGYRRDAQRLRVQELAAFERFISLMFRQLLFTLVPKFICYTILVSTFWFPQHPWAIRTKNCHLDWIITVACMWVVSF